MIVQGNQDLRGVDFILNDLVLLYEIEMHRGCI